MKSIGVFDSGVGGLSVLKTLIKNHPNESFIYLGDTARLPYGTKSKDTIISYVKRNLNYLLNNHDIKAVVVACNSASSVISEVTSSVPLIGVIEAGVRAALKTTKNKRLSLWATRTTVELGQYKKHLDKKEKIESLTSTPCPLLVSLVEEGLQDTEIAWSMFDHYLSPVFQNESDTLIMGCTHFPFLKDSLTKYLKEVNKSLNLIDASSEISIELEKILTQDSKKKKQPSSKQEIKVLLTDCASNFKHFTTKNLPKNLNFEFSMINI